MNDIIKARLRDHALKLRSLSMPACLCACLAGCASPLPPQSDDMQRTPAPLPAPSGAQTAQVPAPVASPQPLSTGSASTGAQSASVMPDKAALLRTWADLQARVYRVAAPLLIYNTELCPRHARNLLGFTAKTRYSYSDAFVDTAQSELQLTDRLRVMNVLPGSGAEQAGLKKGDTLAAVEIEPLPQGPDAERASAAIIASELQGRNNVSLTVLRNGERTVLDIPLTPACAMVIDLGNADFAASLADGQRIMITRGLLNQAQSEQELAYVIAQEMARNILMEQGLPEVAAVIDRLHTLDQLPAEAAVAAGIAPLPAAAALQARKLALYLLARAGYSADGAPAFWQRVGNPPVAEADLPVLMETIGAIRAKQQLATPLIPE